MFPNQVPTIAGVEVPVIADLDPERAGAACRKAGWDEERLGRTRFVASGDERCAIGIVEVISCLERDGRPVFRDLRGAVALRRRLPHGVKISKDLVRRSTWRRGREHWRSAGRVSAKARPPTHPARTSTNFFYDADASEITRLLPARDPA